MACFYLWIVPYQLYSRDIYLFIYLFLSIAYINGSQMHNIISKTKHDTLINFLKRKESCSDSVNQTHPSDFSWKIIYLKLIQHITFVEFRFFYHLIAHMFIIQATNAEENLSHISYICIFLLTAWQLQNSHTVKGSMHISNTWDNYLVLDFVCTVDYAIPWCQ